jgi:FkbM family methyltransferase
MLEKNVKINDKMYSIVSDDNYLDAVGENFEPHMVQLYRALVCKHDVVADIGANIGLTALLFSSLASKVFAFEPSPSTYKILETNLARAGVTNVEAVNIGLGDKTETKTITFSKNNRSGAYVSDKICPKRGHVTEKIKIDTLDNYFSAQKFRPTFLKIDVEGFEQNVIKGAKKILSETKPIVVMEMNHFCLNVLHRITLPDFLEFMCSTFPYLYAVDTDNKTIIELHDPDDCYFVMYEHVVRHRFPNLVGGFDSLLEEKVGHLAESTNQNVIEKKLVQFNDLLAAAKCYIAKGLDLKELYPLSAENEGCLDKSYGGYEKPAPNYNWTTQGGWLGIWGNENQIGVGVTGSFEEVKPVIEKYKANAKEIFFPYPTRYDVTQKIEPNTKGQLLMVFEKGFVLS